MRIGPKEQAVLDQLTEDEIPLTDLARRLRGWHFKDIQNAAAALVRKGLVEHRTDPREGVVLKRLPIENRLDGIGKAPPGPPSGFGKEKTREDYRRRIDWEAWAAAKAREDGHEAVAQGHDMARAAYVTEYTLKRPPSLGNTIRDQIGGRALQMLGAKDFVGDDDSLTFRIGRNAQGVTHIRIQLDPSDTYTVQFLKVGRAPYFHRTVVSEASDIYVDQLRGLIERKTGLYTSL